MLDIGTGLGWNLAATLEARDALRLRPLPKLELVTLETSRSVLEASFELQRAIPQGESLGTIHSALRRSLESEGPGPVSVVPGVELRLYLGDARASVLELAESPGFDAFYLDPFSPRREPGLWTEAFLSRLARIVAPGARLHARALRKEEVAAALEVTHGHPARTHDSQRGIEGGAAGR